MSVKKIQSTVADRFDSRIYMLVGKRDNKPFSHGTILLTFEVPSSASFTDVRFEGIPACPYNPNPMRRY
jgi:hypothetical protein